jgi:hypothetical protein
VAQAFGAASDIFCMDGRDVDMPDGNASMILYDPSDSDLSQVLLRCSDLAGFICQVLYPGSDPTGHDADPKLSHTDPPATLLWWLCSLRVTLENLACTLATAPPDALTTALQGYLTQHPEQAAELRRVFVEANERDFAQWDRVRALIAPAAGSSALAERQGEAGT